MSKYVAEKIESLIGREAGYVNHPNDRGGETIYGITKAVARAFGYQGPMRDMPIETARAIYNERYWLQPRFDAVTQLDARIGEKLFDIGVNMGQEWGGRFLQRALNTLNRQGKDFPDISVDGNIGKMTLYAMLAFLKFRGKEGAENLYEMIDAQQRVRYMEISEKNQTQEDFSNGWQSRAGLV